MSDNICLLLGAGVSAEQELPTWIDLVKGVVNYYSIDLNVDKDNLISSIGIIEDDRFADIQDSLSHAGIGYDINQCQEWSRRKIALATRVCLKKKLINQNLSDIKSKMMLMKNIVESVYERVEKNLLTTIITYNFDDYFEFAFKCLLAEKGELGRFEELLEIRTIGSDEQHLPSGCREKKLINVYHVHGFIPIFDELFASELYKKSFLEYKSENIDFYEKCLDAGIVFSESDYSTLRDDSIVGWTNMIQYICYSQLDVITVGFSLTDANFRTLISRMRKSKDKIKSAILFLGFPDGDNKKKAAAETSSHTAEYLFKDVCEDVKCKVCAFCSELPNEVRDSIDFFVK